MAIGLLPILILVVVFALTLSYRAKSAKARVTEPSCGGCGYCVRGLETFTCPECGGDLRELGIVTPGSVKPMSGGMRLLLWTIAIPLPAYVIGHIISDRLAPWETTGTEQRVVFSHVPGVNATVRVVQTGRRVNWGRVAAWSGPPPQAQEMALTLEHQRNATPLTVKLSDADPPDAKMIADWLRTQAPSPFTGAGVDEFAGYVNDAIYDMRNSQSRGFLNFRSPDQQPRATAHPPSRSVNVARPIGVTPYVPYAFAALLWLIGLPVVLRRRRGVQSATHANQA